MTAPVIGPNAHQPDSRPVHREVDVLPPAPPVTMTIRQSSPLRPISICIGLSILVLSGSFIAARAIYGDSWLAEHRAAVQADTSAISIPARDNLGELRPGEIELTIADEQGRAVRVASSKTALSDFEKEMVLFLKRKEDTALLRFETDVKTAFDTAFAGSAADLEAYANWFFAWQRSWVLMKEALLAGGTEIVNLLSPAKVWEAISARTRGYLMENYQSRVLKPQQRNAVLQRGLQDAFQKAHADYRNTVAELGVREQAFVRKHTRLLEAYPPGSVQMKLDWPAQRFKIPAHFAEDRAERVYRSAAIMGASVAATPLLAPILARVSGGVMNKLAGRVIRSRAGMITGGALAAETLGLSILIGGAIDWAANKVDKTLSKANFIEEHQRALQETRDGWQRLAMEQLGPVVQRWHADTRQAVVLVPQNTKSTPRS